MDEVCLKDLLETLKESLKLKSSFGIIAQAVEDLNIQAYRLLQSHEESASQISDLESKLKEAQKLYYNEKQKATAAIKERNKLMSLLNNAREILKDEKMAMHNNTRERLSFLNQPTEVLGSEKLETIVELNSTDGLMSELSYTLDDEDASSDTSLRRSHRQKRAPCRFPSDVSLEPGPSKKSKGRHSSQYKALDKDEQVIATTTVTVPQNGPVTARSVIESVPASITRYDFPQLGSKYLPSAPPVTLFDTDSDTASSGNNAFHTPKKPFACQTNLRLHNWNQKSHIMGETCSVCCKKMRFSTVAVKCSNCKAIAHTGCQERVPLPCVPVAINTPSTKSVKSGNIADFVPQTSPMVPALVVHCVREIEARGFGEVGLYRVPGSDKEVKTLKEKLLKAKGVIDLSNVVDIHTVCGCLKEFLRSLKEPLIPQSLWKELALVTEIPDGEQKKNKIFNFIQRLPQANRDTLAFITLHLQRVAAAPNCKMPVANLSKMFGPSIIGYSKYEPDNILMETNISNKIMAELLLLPTECWEEILYPCNNENQNPKIMKTPSQSSLLGFFTNSTSSVRTVRKARKFFDTP